MKQNILDHLTTATKISQYAFVYRYSLTSITIPNSVTTIERNAFYGCNIITAKGMGVSCYFALEIIKALLDDKTANQVAESAIIE